MLRPALLILLACVPLSAAAQNVFWADFGEDAIRFMDASVGGAYAILTFPDTNGPTAIAIDEANQHLYWCDAGTNSIKRSDLFGGNVVTLISSGLSFPNGIELDVAMGHMYITSFGTSEILRANLDGSNVVVIHSLPGSQPRGIGLDLAGGKMYYQYGGTQQILRSNLNGSFEEPLLTTGSVPHDLEVDPVGGKVYWVEFGSEKVRRMNLDGSLVEDLVSPALFPRGIEIDETLGTLWWTEADPVDPAIATSNLDGSMVSEPLMGAPLIDPWGVAVTTVPEPGSSLLLATGTLSLLCLARRRPRLDRVARLRLGGRQQFGVTRPHPGRGDSAQRGRPAHADPKRLRVAGRIDRADWLAWFRCCDTTFG